MISENYHSKSLSGVLHTRYHDFSDLSRVRCLKFSILFALLVGVFLSSSAKAQLAPDLRIDKDTSTAVVAPNGAASYSIAITNEGTAEATGVIATDVLPTGFTFVANASINEVGATRSLIPSDPVPGDTSLSWGEWTIQVGGSVTINFTANVGSSLGVFDNTAALTAMGGISVTDEGEVAEDSGSPSPSGSDPESDEDVLVGEPRISITKFLTDETDVDGVARPGETLTYTVSLSNTGNVAGTIQVTETVPLGTQSAGGDSFAAACSGGDAAGTACTVTSPMVPPNDALTMTFSVVVDDPLAQTDIVNSVFELGTTPPICTALNNGDPRCVATPVSQPLCAAGSDDVGGNVFLDVNSNGTRDANEVGQGEITVSAYEDGNPVAIATTTVARDGQYNFVDLLAGRTGDARNIRLEFNGFPSHITSSSDGSTTGTATQFVNGESCSIDLAVTNEAFFCSDNPQVAFAQSFAGLTSFSDGDSLLLYDYQSGEDSRTTNADVATINGSVPLARWGTSNSDGIGTGAVYGVAYDQTDDNVFAASFTKLGSVLRGENPGSSSPGNLFRVSDPNGAANFSVFATLPAGTDPFDYSGIGGPSWLVYTVDANFNAVGRVGLAGMDISADDQSLYVWNLADRQLYEVDADTGATTNTFGLPPIPVGGAGECPAETDLIPGAVKVNPITDNVFVAVTCTVAPLQGYIYELDPGAGTYTERANIDLSYERGSLNSGTIFGTTDDSNWQPWRTTYNPAWPQNNLDQFHYPQPWILDIEFDEQNYMMLGISDRFGHQIGPGYPQGFGGVAGGDALLLAPSDDGNSWKLESNGYAGSRQASNVDRQSFDAGPGNQEFYYEDRFGVDVTANGGDPFQNFPHGETVSGGIAYLPGSAETLFVAMDPGAVASPAGFGTSGVISMSNNTGMRTRSIQFTDDFPGFGKATGGGDLEIICPPAPIEIGNRVWKDNSEDGIQDPSEPPIPGVTVQLFVWNDNGDGVYQVGEIGPAVLQGGNPVTAITDAKGEYYFGQRSGDPSLGFVGPNGLDPNTKYIVGIQPSQASLSLLPVVTLTETGGNTEIDSNGQAGIEADLIVAPVLTRGPGDNDHSIDFGFYAELDLGDAPDTYSTLLSSGGPSHAKEQGLTLGTVFDSELDGQPSAGADGDDLVDNSGAATTQGSAADDEDSIDTSLVVDLAVADGTGAQTTSYTLMNVAVTNDTGDNATVVGFIDFNGDGDFNDPGETSTPVPANASGSVNLTFTGIGAIAAGDTFLRLRLSSDATAIATPGGIAPDGEIEDHPITIKPVVRSVKVLVPAATNMNQFLLSISSAPITTASGSDGTNTSYVPFMPGMMSPLILSETNLSMSGVPQDTSAGPDGVFVTQAICRDENGFTVLTGNTERVNNGDSTTGGTNGASISSGNFALAGSSKAENTITCTWTNLAPALVSVVKQTVPASNTQSFDFAIDIEDGVGNFEDYGAPAMNNFSLTGAAPNNQISNMVDIADVVTGGELALREVVPEGWVTSAVSCVADDAGGAFTLTVNDPVPRNGAIFPSPEIVDQSIQGLENGDTVNCTYENTLLGSLGSTLWVESPTAALNGIQDVGESVIVGATVRLLNADGTPVRNLANTADLTTMTDSNGKYFFNDLLPADYIVQVDLGVGAPTATGVATVGNLVPTINQVANASNDVNLDTNIDLASTISGGGTGQIWNSGLVSLSPGSEPAMANTELEPDGATPDQPGQTYPSTNPRPDNTGNMTIDFGFVNPYSVGSVVFLDNNDSGTQDVGEPGISGIGVQLFASDGVTEITVGPDGILGTVDDAVGGITTGPNGGYNFSGLPQGDYIVRFEKPANTVPSSTQVVDPDNNVNLDSNLDVPDPTNASFDTGVFTLGADGPEPLAAMEAVPGGAPGSDTDTSNTTDEFGNMTVDAGFVPLLSLGNVIFEDQNNNSVYDGVSDGLVIGATVTLLKLDTDNASGTFGTFIPALDAFGDPIGAQVTGSDGMYNFENLVPGDYQVVTSIPNSLGLKPVALQVPDPDGVTGTDDVDNDSNIATTTAGVNEVTYTSGTVTLQGGTEPVDEEGAGTDGNNGNLTVDMGFFQPLSLGSVVYTDGNDDGIVDATDNNGLQDIGEPGINGSTVFLFTTPDNGLTLIPVRVDANGVYDPNQMGASAADNSVITSTIGGVDGTYNFSGLPANTYVVQVTPPGGLFPAANQNASPSDGTNLDSNLDLSMPSGFGTWQSGLILLASNVSPEGAEENDPNGVPEVDPSGIGALKDSNSDLTNDYGFVQKVALGNTVWLDDGAGAGIKDDGILNGGEKGVSGVLVEIYADGAVLGTDAPIATTYTDSNGNYLFDFLDQGSYFVHIPASNFSVGGPLQDLVSSSPEGGDDQNDQNADENGLNTLVNGGVSTATIELSIGGELENEPSASAIASAQADNSTDSTIDFGFVPADLGSIGNYVWIDEDSDGQQDAGEVGLANIEVILKDENGDEIARTTTDANGGYLFTSLPEGTYFVDINELSLPVGMTQTDIFTNVVDGSDADAIDDDGDFGNKDHSGVGYQIVLDEGEDNLTADFGYNYNTTSQVNDNIGTAALGDRIWIDANGDGVQDANEVPVAGVVISLFIDPDGDGVFDTPYAANPTQTTDANGNYLFDDLPTDAYVVEVTDSSTASHDILGLDYAQTGDPDHFGAAVATAGAGDAGDNKSTSPIVLTPGDVFLNADFGYQPAAGVTGSIGDTIWLDIDSDGNGPSQTGVADNIASTDELTPITQGAGGAGDADESGIAGVTVSLLNDLNGNGVVDAGEPFIANDTTDANGQYLFEGLNIDDALGNDYIVVITDTRNVLDGFNPTFDSDGSLATPNASAVTDLAGDDREQDFGFVNGQPLGSIGDTIWGDIDNSGTDQATQGAEPGLPGVTVNLYADENADGSPDDVNGDGVVDANDALRTTRTDGNGNYLFTGLPLTSYVVGVDDSSLPTGYNGDSSFLPNGAGSEDDAATSNDLSDTVSLTEATPHDREQDFSYPLIPDALGSGVIGDTIWGDTDGDGNGPNGAGDGSDINEPPLAGVTVRLFDSVGNLLDTQVTDANGQYLFAGLDPDGQYNVVVDTSTLPASYNPVPVSDPENDGNSASFVDLGDGGVGSEDGNADPDGTANGQNLGQDFGYQLLTIPLLGSIGDTIWFDVDSSADDQTNQGAEPGLDGVTVTLTPSSSLVDLGNGPGQPITTTTNANGEYLFDDLPLNEEYTVGVDTSTLPNYVSTQATFDADGGIDSSSAITITTASPDNRTQDFSYPPLTTPGSIGDKIYIDSDESNSLTEGDLPVSGVLVNLLDSNGDIIATATTTANGMYLFPNLDPNADYSVQVDPSNFIAGGSLEGMNNTVDPDGGNDNSSIPNLSLADPNDLDQDFGYTAANPVAVGNLVWLDINADGVYQPDGADGIAGNEDDESPIGDVTVELYRDLNGNGEIDPGEPLFGTTITSSIIDAGEFQANGNYLFEGLPADDYVVKVTDDAGVLNGYWHSEGDQAADNNSKVETYAVNANGGDNITADFGYYVKPGSVGDVVWEDINGNGVYDPATEPGVENVKVTLTITNPDGSTIVLNTLTDQAGNYQFDNLNLDEDFDGVAIISYGGGGDEPAHVVTLDSASTPSNLDPIYDNFPANTDTTNVGGDPADEDDLDVGGDDGVAGEPAFPPMGGIDPTNDFGFSRLASLGNRVWLDFDMDGVQDQNEDGIANVTVNLLDENNNIVGTQVTGANGEYLFTDLMPGVPYRTMVVFASVPNGLIQTFDEGPGGAIGSLDHTSDPITLTPGEEHLTADFGYAPAPGVGALGDTIWVDSNGNGMQDPGEPGIPGVTVTLTPPPNVDPDGPGPANAGDTISVVTDENGKYLFTDLPLNKTYIVAVDTMSLPLGYGPVPNGLGDPDVRDGKSTDADDQTFVVLTDDKPVNLDADFGYLPESTVDNRIGDTIWKDLNRDGVLDLDESGIPGVTVTLLDNSGVPIATVITDAMGNYEFSGLPDGSYTVLVTDANNVLADLEQTYDRDDPANPGNFIAATPNSSSVSVAGGETNTEQDFGYVDPSDSAGPGSIGDTIFFDSDESGAPDPGEGLEGVTVRLFGAGPDGDISTAGDNVLLHSVVTDENGNYLFTGLDVGDQNGVATGSDYQVVVDVASLPNAGAGWSNTVDPENLITGTNDSQSVTNLSVASPQDLDQDFGYVGEGGNSLSGTVWPDTNGDGAQDEAGNFPGVTVVVTDQQGNIIRQVLTDANGNYMVDNLPDGIYVVMVTDDNNVLAAFEHTDSPNGASDDSDQTSKDDTGYTVDLDSTGQIAAPVADQTGDFGYEPVVTNPISLGYFLATAGEANEVLIEFATQTEVANLGFALYANVAGEWLRLSDDVILSQGDSVSIQSYTAVVNTEAEVFALSDIDLNGKETLHGPFILGQPSGQIAERKVIDWRAEKAEREAKKARRDARRKQQQERRTLRRKLNRQSSIDWNLERSMFDQVISGAIALTASVFVQDAHAAQAMDVVNLKTTQAGIHQISHADLLAYGVDLAGEVVTDIALMNAGSPVSIQVIGSDADDSLFGEGALIRFIAKAKDTLYTDTNVYTLKLDGNAAQRMSIDDSAMPRAAFASSYLATKKFAPQAKYSFTSPNSDDPWYAKRIVAVGKSISENMLLNLEDYAPGGNTGSTKAKMRVDVWGGSDLAGEGDDHHVQVSMNGESVIDGTFDGLNAKQFKVELESVQNGNNVVTMTLPMDTGYAYDAVNLNEVEVQYPRKFVAIDNRLNFASSFSKFYIPNFAKDENGAIPNVVAMREDSAGVSVVAAVNVSCRESCRAIVGGSGKNAQYYIASETAIHRPSLDALPLAQDITSEQAVYLIISHPDFVGSDGNNLLEGLANTLVSEMGSAKVVDVEAIYAQFGHHLFDPQAIQRYIQYAHANLGTKYILLVGGDVYDYRQFENQDATSFIPSLYAATGNNITFAPVDAKYADIDGDNVPDIPIGRLPVRTVGQLQTLLNKRVAYLNRDYAGTALLVADDYDQVQQYDFGNDADEIELDFLSGYRVEKAYVDDLGTTAARAKAMSEINQGTSLTAFFGHSSTNQWSFNGLFTGPDAANLQNQGKPTVVTQWGCWNAYYVSPSEDSMGHRFMMEGDRGAVAVMGASTLTNANSERKLARLVFARIAMGERLGDAVTNAKQEYALDNPNDLDVLLGWTVLGMPDLVVN